MSTLDVPGSDASKETWKQWVHSHINTTNKGEDDFGLSRIAQHLGGSRMQGLSLYWDGAEKENGGDVDGGIKLYRQAYKLWPA